MTLARRLLAGGVGGSLQVAAPIEDVLTTAPDGGWSATGANAIRHNGIVYFGWTDGSGHVAIATYDEATGAVSSAVTLATFAADWHATPAIAVRDDGHIVVVYSEHNAAAIYVRISTNPEDATSFGAAVNIDSQLGGSAYTYPTLILADSSLVLFYRHNPGDGSASWRYSSSADGGTTWAAETHLYDTSAFGYFNVDWDGTRFDFSVTDGSALGDGASVYHFYRLGSTYYQSDGTPIAASLPLGSGDLTQVWDGAAGAVRSPYCVVSGTRPALTFSTYVAGGVSPDQWHYARWSGSAWLVSDIADDGASGFAWGIGGVALERSAIGTAWFSRRVSGHYQVYRYRTWNDGASWTVEQIGSSSSDDFYPVTVRAPGRLRAIWVRGTATSYSSYSLGIVGGVLY